jgi:hypothetical protein
MDSVSQLERKKLAAWGTAPIWVALACLIAFVGGASIRLDFKAGLALMGGIVAVGSVLIGLYYCWKLTNPRQARLLPDTPHEKPVGSSRVAVAFGLSVGTGVAALALVSSMVPGRPMDPLFTAGLNLGGLAAAIAGGATFYWLIPILYMPVDVPVKEGESSFNPLITVPCVAVVQAFISSAEKSSELGFSHALASGLWQALALSVAALAGYSAFRLSTTGVDLKAFSIKSLSL